VKVGDLVMKVSGDYDLCVIGIIIFVDQNDAGNVIAKVWDGKKEKSYFGDYLKVISERKEE
jgi:hypothetical protein